MEDKPDAAFAGVPGLQQPPSFDFNDPKPQWPEPEAVKCQDEEMRRRQKKDFDRRHAATVLPPLEPGDTVWVRDIKETACVLSPASKPRSYVVETPTAVLVRNRVHLVPYSDSTTSQLREKKAKGKKSKKSKPPLQMLPEQQRHKSPMKAELESPGKSLFAGSLLCNLGLIRFSGTYVYPADGLCNLITFHCLFVTGGITLSPPYSDEFDTFLETASRHRITGYAIGIDHKKGNPATPSRPTSTIPRTELTTTTRKATRTAPGKSLFAGSLLCTLGLIRFSGTYVYPADGLCSLITFDCLFVTGGITLSPPYSDEFDTFLETASHHRITEYAIGIDHKNENQMNDLIANPAATTTLDDVCSRRLHHYVQVNTPVMEASGNSFDYVTQSAKGLQMISQLMRNKADSEGVSSLTILHYPLMYDSMAADVARALTIYPVDILVAIGYTSYSDYGTKDCRMVPPVLHTKELLEPSLLNTTYPVRLVRVLSATAKFKEQPAVTSAVAVSLGMGGRWYTPMYPAKLPNIPRTLLIRSTVHDEHARSWSGRAPNMEHCRSMCAAFCNLVFEDVYIFDLDLFRACKLSNYKSKFAYDDTFQAEFAYGESEKMLFTYDDTGSLRFKLYETPGIPADLHYILAADNVQYEDFVNVCGRGPYSRLRLLKTLARFSA
ncbi:hypothetical protein MTO96_020309 [Rhipicephalus appendiculatus]